MTDAKNPPAFVIDKNTSARINVTILISIVVTCVVAAWYLQDIEHQIETMHALQGQTNTTLQEVKAQLAAQDGRSLGHTTTLIRHGDRLNQNEKAIESLGTRVRELERGK